MRYSPEYYRLSKIEWSDLYTLRIRGRVGLNNPFSRRTRDEIASSLASVIRSLNKERGNGAIWVYSNDFSSADLLLDSSYSQIQILYKRTRKDFEQLLSDDAIESKLNDFLKEYYLSNKIHDTSIDLMWVKHPTDEQVKYFFKIKEDSEYKHFIYSKQFIKNIDKLENIITG